MAKSWTDRIFQPICLFTSPCPALRLSGCTAYPSFTVSPFLLSAFRRIISLLPYLECCFSGTFLSSPVGFPVQRWTVALDSVTLKCISCKILPFCESVIFRKKCRKQLGRQSLKGTCKSQGGSDRKLDRTEGNKKNQVQTKFCDYGNNSSSSINGEKHHDGGIGKRTAE